MATVRSYNKVTGVIYVYDSHKVWSKTDKKYKTVRKCIGKVDPTTGKIIPTGPRGRPRREPRELNSEPTTGKTPAISAPGDPTAEDVQALHAMIARLKLENSLLRSEREKIRPLLDGIMHFAEQARELLDQTDSALGDP